MNSINNFHPLALRLGLASVVLGAGITAFAVRAEERKNAIDRFGAQFSESGSFDCVSGRTKLGLGLGLKAYDAPLPADMTKEQMPMLFGVVIETYPTKKTNHIASYSGIAEFEDGDKKMSVKLNNGKVAVFERFGPTPDWPFKSKKDSQLFFTFRLDDGPIYQCKAVYQPDQ